MCGLFGYAGTAPADKALLETLRLAAARRGPDGWAVFDGETVSQNLAAVPLQLGHCRLATTGNPTTVQPIVWGGVAVTHNGNIPNYRQYGPLDTGCDSELIARRMSQGVGLSDALRSLNALPYAVVAVQNNHVALAADGLPLFVKCVPGGMYWCSVSLGDDWMAKKAAAATFTAKREAAVGAENQPLSRVEWVPLWAITPNDYNPNKQPPPEFKLLLVSIQQDGWTQPIVVFDDGEGGPLTIVDGEHRWRASGVPEVAALTGGLIPIVRIRADRSHRIMSTIRHNRARGEHGVKNMASLVRELLENNKSVDEICVLLGMEDEEVERLADASGMPTRVGSKESFSPAWIPQSKAPLKKEMT